MILLARRPAISTLFPYTTLFRSYRPIVREQTTEKLRDLYWGQGYNDVEVDISTRRRKEAGELDVIVQINEGRQSVARDRKSTRLNSSHANISYAVFCLKKKKIKT